MPTGKMIETCELYAGRVVHLALDTVELPNGNQTQLEIVRHPGAAAIVPIDEEGRVVMIRQYRYATGGYLLEVPAGKLDPGEEPATCAARELVEEVGLFPGDLIPMGVIWTTPGFTDERIYLFAARQLEVRSQALERDEVLTIERIELDEAVRRARTGEIEDGKSACALMRVNHFLGQT